ncbi:MAG: M67 family metallopeptidase [Lachnospiraceae bacterium]|nr:M67 family metallopeptidase [Lachnospiraceae bacterium]
MSTENSLNDSVSAVYRVDADKEILRNIISSAEREYPCECCGILIGSFSENCIRLSDAIETDNIESTTKRADSFLIDPREIYECERSLIGTGLEITGFYHSHPDLPAVLSKSDEAGMIPDQMYVIISVCKGKCEDITAYIKTDEIIYEAELRGIT